MNEQITEFSYFCIFRKCPLEIGSVHSLSTLIGTYWTFRFTFWSSAAVAYPLRGLMCCVFTHALLHNRVLMCGYLHYCHLPVSFDQSGSSFLTDLINNAFLHVCCTIRCKL